MNSRIVARFACFFAVAISFAAFAEDVTVPAARPEVVEEPQAATTGDDSVATAAEATPAADSLPAANAAPAADTAVTAASATEDPVVCKRFEATGTRLRKGKVCKPLSYWNQQEKRAEEIATGIERGASAGVGGDDPSGR